MKLSNSPISRRQFLQTLGALAGSLSIAPTAFASSIELKELTVTIPNLPPSFSGYRIGFLSDLHLGVWVTNEEIESAVLKLRLAKIDIALVGGDLIGLSDGFPGGLIPYAPNKEFKRMSKSERPAAIFNRVADLLSPLRPPDGIHAVYGNHDNWVNPKLCADSLTTRKINLLVNSKFEVRRGPDILTLLGPDDYWTGSPYLVVPPKKEANELRVVLAHNPDYVSYLLTKTSYEVDIALCGHTHGGQIKLPIIGPLFYNLEDLRLAEGLYTSGNTHVFTTRGIGMVELPLRINCPPEVNVITLV